MAAYLIGYDIGSSSIKATLIEIDSGKVLASSIAPQSELSILSTRPGWAEQNPNEWWSNIIATSKLIRVKSGVQLSDVEAIGISYQEHGLILIDRTHQVQRPAIIWCDSRAVDIGEEAFEDIGREICIEHLMNSPGNFTASKLRWVIKNEHDLFVRTYKLLLPGDYVNLKMTGEINTTIEALSQGMLWDFKNRDLAEIVLKHYEIPRSLIPDVVPSFAIQGRLTDATATELGMKKGTPVSFRGGDQLSNALALRVVGPGDVAANAGTSGAILAISEKKIADPFSRVNTFAHVNYTIRRPIYGVILCINGTGSSYRWLRSIVGFGSDRRSYDQMNEMASRSSVGAKGISFYPFGNGSERTLQNLNTGAMVRGINYNMHGLEDILRAAQEGIIFAMNYGLEIIKNLGIPIDIVRASYANMFQSKLFSQLFSTITRTQLELFETDGSRGAALGAGIGAGVYRNLGEALDTLKSVEKIEPSKIESITYLEEYHKWLDILNKQLLHS